MKEETEGKHIAHANDETGQAADGAQTLAMATAQACPQISTSCCCPKR